MNAENNTEKGEDIIVAMSPMTFVICCLGLLMIQGLEPSDFIGMEELATKTLAGSWALWAGLWVSLLIMLFFGVPSVRSQVAALAVALIGVTLILSLAGAGVSWVALMLTLFAVFVPGGDLLFRRLSKIRSGA